MRLERFKTSSGVMDYLASLFELERLFGVQVVDRPHSYCLLHQIAIFFAGSECNNLASPSSSPSPFRSVNCNVISILHFPEGCQIPYGLVVRIRRSHRRGPGSIPGVGSIVFFWGGFCRSSFASIPFYPHCFMKTLEPHN